MTHVIQKGFELTVTLQTLTLLFALGVQLHSKLCFQALYCVFTLAQHSWPQSLEIQHLKTTQNLRKGYFFLLGIFKDQGSPEIQMGCLVIDHFITPQLLQEGGKSGYLLACLLTATQMVGMLDELHVRLLCGIQAQTEVRAQWAAAGPNSILPASPCVFAASQEGKSTWLTADHKQLPVSLTVTPPPQPQCLEFSFRAAQSVDPRQKFLMLYSSHWHKTSSHQKEKWKEAVNSGTG